MKVQAITPELRRWIIEQAQAGCRPDDVLAAMRASGWQDDVALDALESTLRQHLAQQSVALDAPTAVAVPGPDLDGSPNRLRVGEHEIGIVMTLRSPRLIVFGGFLTDDECDALIASAAPRMTRSETVVYATGASEVHAARTSSGMFFGRGESPLCLRIEQRIAALLKWPIENGEGLQVLHYEPGAEYKPHHDYFDPSQPGMTSVLARGGQRVGTFLMYLNNPAKGGATVFPDAGLEVAPIKGHAVFFSYDRPHAMTRSLHGGAPVFEGEKWVATKWLREGEFV